MTSSKEVLTIIDIPLSVMSFLRDEDQDDKEMVIFTLFWALTDTFESMDLSPGTYEGYCNSQFAQWAHDYYLDQMDLDDPQGQKDYDRIFSLFQRFNEKINNADLWRSLGLYFFNKLDRYKLTGDECLYDVNVYPKTKSIEILVSVD